MEGSLDERMATFERSIAEYEKASKEILSDKMRIGILTIRLPDGPLKQHVLMHSLKLNTWLLMKQELLDITRAQSAASPMELSAFTKGGPKGGGRGGGDKSKMKCNHCGKLGHLWKDCRSRLAESGGGGGNKPKGKGKGAKAKAKGGGGFTGKCFKCGKVGHRSADCKKKLHALEDGDLAGGAAEGQEAGVIDGLTLDDLTLPLFALELADTGQFQRGVQASGSSEPGTLGAMTKAGRRSIRLSVDSGAVVTVIPPDVGSSYPIRPNPESRRGAHYRSVSGHQLADQGTRPLIARTPDGKRKLFKPRVVDANRGLLSVYEHVLENKNSVHFTPQGSWSEDAQGKKTQFEIRNRCFELPIEVVDYDRLGPAERQQVDSAGTLGN
jgi:hypothetical protein